MLRLIGLGTVVKLGYKKSMHKFMALLFMILFSLSSMAAPETKFIAGEDLLTGENVSINSERKKGLVAVFFSAKCPCSHSHNTELRELAETYKDFNFVAIHSNIDEGKELTKPYFEKAHFPFPVIEDKEGNIAEQLQAYKTPHAFVFSTTGETLYEGGVSNSKNCDKATRKYLREALADIQADQKVKTPEGRTLGCVISRKKQNVF